MGCGQLLPLPSFSAVTASSSVTADPSTCFFMVTVTREDGFPRRCFQLYSPAGVKSIAKRVLMVGFAAFVSAMESILLIGLMSALVASLSLPALRMKSRGLVLFRLLERISCGLSKSQQIPAFSLRTVGAFSQYCYANALLRRGVVTAPEPAFPAVATLFCRFTDATAPRIAAGV